MRILFITAYYPPLNTIASHRVKGFCESCSRNGVQFDVITRKYDEEQNKGQNMFIASKAPSDFIVDYEIVGNIYYTNFYEKNKAIRISNLLPRGLRGLYNYSKHDVYHYGWLEYIIQVYEEKLKGNKYDFIVASYGPLISLVAAKILSIKYSIPFIADFRDAFIDGSEGSLSSFFKKWQLRTVLENCKGISFASDGMREIFYTSFSNKSIPSNVIYNGTEINYEDCFQLSDKNTVQEFTEIKSQNDLVLLYTGTLYNGQDIHFYIEAVSSFLSKNQKVKIAIVFLGLPENNLQALPNFAFIYYLPRVEFKTTAYLQKRASALLSPVWFGRYTGFSGKIFEYLSSGNLVLVGPNPQNDILKFLGNFSNAKICNTISELEQCFYYLMDFQTISKSEVNLKLLSRKYWSDQFLFFLKSL